MSEVVYIYESFLQAYKKFAVSGSVSRYNDDVDNIIGRYADKANEVGFCQDLAMAWSPVIARVQSDISEESTLDVIDTVDENAFLFRDCWRLYKKYSSVESLNENDWEEFLSETSRILQKYQKKQFAKDILVAIVSEAERKGKRGEAVEK
jgi:hypothetical protein